MHKLASQLFIQITLKIVRDILALELAGLPSTPHWNAPWKTHRWESGLSILIRLRLKICFCSQEENELSCKSGNNGKYFLFCFYWMGKQTLIWILNHPEYLAENMFLLFTFLGLACYAPGISIHISCNIFSFHILIFNILYTLFNLNGCLISVFHPQRSY